MAKRIKPNLAKARLSNGKFTFMLLGIPRRPAVQKERVRVRACVRDPTQHHCLHYLRHHGWNPPHLRRLNSCRSIESAGLGRHGMAVPKSDGECQLGEQRGLGRGAPLR